MEVDACLCDFCDLEFLDGKPGSEGDRLRCALEAKHPEFMSSGKLPFPRFKRAIKGWRKHAPTQSRVPLPEDVELAIAGHMRSRGSTGTGWGTLARGPRSKARMCAADARENVLVCCAACLSFEFAYRTECSPLNSFSNLKMPASRLGS